MSERRLLLRRGNELAAFGPARAGLAAVEFALLAPILVFLFFAVVEGSNALSVGRRVSLAVNTLADLASQETAIAAGQASDLFTGVEQIVAQGDIDARIRLISLVLDPDMNKLVVDWSCDDTGGEPYAPGSAYSGLADGALLDASSSLIVGEISYAYTPPLTKFLIPSIAFEKKAARWSRRSGRIRFCTSPGVCTN